MTPGTQIACPRCGMRYSLTNPRLVGQTVPCSNCHQSFVAQPFVPHNYPAAPTGFAGSPQLAANPFGTSPQGAMLGMGMPDVGGMQSPFGAVPRRRKGANTGLLIGGLTGGGVLVAVVLALGLWKTFFRTSDTASGGTATATIGSNPTNSDNPSPTANDITNASTATTPPTAVQGVRPSGLNPFADTPEKVTKDLVVVQREANAVVRSIRDVASRDAAISKIAAVIQKFDDLLSRACRFAPLPDTELQALVRKTNQELQPLANETDQISKQIQSSGLVNDDLVASVGMMTSASRQVVDAIDTGLRQLPVPQKNGDKLELEVCQIFRGSLVIVSQIQAASDFDAATAELKKQADAMQGLIDRLEKLSPQEAAELTTYGIEFQKYWLQSKSLFDNVTRAKFHQFGENTPFELAMHRLSELHSNYNFAKVRAGLGNKTALNRQGGQPGFSPGIPGGQPGQPKPGQDGPGGPPGFPPGFPGGPPKSGQGVPNGPDFFTDMFVKQFGAANVVAVSFPRLDDALAKQIVAELCRLTTSESSSTATSGNSTKIMVKYAGDLQVLADRINFGRVTSIDKATRTIQVEPN